MFSKISLQLSHHHLHQLWVERPFLLCIALWDSSVHQQNARKIMHFLVCILTLLIMSLSSCEHTTTHILMRMTEDLGHSCGLSFEKQEL